MYVYTCCVCGGGYASGATDKGGAGGCPENRVGKGGWLHWQRVGPQAVCVCVGGGGGAKCIYVAGNTNRAEFRSCVKVEVTILGSPRSHPNEPYGFCGCKATLNHA